MGSPIFWRLLLETLIEWGFKPKDYDKYLAIKMVNGKMYYNMTINDLSHVEKEWWKTLSTTQQKIQKI